jgi:hypothetical protein
MYSAGGDFAGFKVFCSFSGKVGIRPFGFAQGRLFGGCCFMLDSRLRGNDKTLVVLTLKRHEKSSSVGFPVARVRCVFLRYVRIFYF